MYDLKLLSKILYLSIKFKKKLRERKRGREKHIEGTKRGTYGEERTEREIEMGG